MRTRSTLRLGLTAASLVAWVALVPATARAQAGLPLWTNGYHGTGNDHDIAKSLAVDASGNVYVTGQSPVFNGPPDYATLKYSTAGVPLWTNRYNGLGDGYDAAAALAVEGNGNVVVTGSSFNGANVDYTTIKYSTTGVPVWTNRYNGPANQGDYASAVALDTNGNVYVTGFSIGTGSGADYATIKYSNAGVPSWINRYNSPANLGDYAHAVALDASGNAFVTGDSEVADYTTDYATIAYSSAGVPLWTNRYNGPGSNNDSANAIAVDSSGNVVVAGSSAGSGTGIDYATIKYSSAGTPLWTNRYNGPGNLDDIVSAIGVDASGNVFVTGSSMGSGSGQDYATIKYSAAGIPLWTNRYNGPGNSADSASAIAADSNGNVYVTGFSGSGGSSWDYATVAYSGAGVPLWTNRYNGPGNSDDRATAVAVDSSGNVYVTGQSWGTAGYWDYATLSYAGAPRTPPVITNTVVAGGYLVFSGTGGSAGGGYYVLASTNVTAWMTNWLSVATNTFACDGSFSVTTVLDPAKGRQFFRIQVP